MMVHTTLPLFTKFLLAVVSFVAVLAFYLTVINARDTRMLRQQLFSHGHSRLTNAGVSGTIAP